MSSRKCFVEVVSLDLASELTVNLERILDVDNYAPTADEKKFNEMGEQNYGYFDGVGVVSLLFGLILVAICVTQLIVREKRSG